jgi:hypothetical protein
MISKFNQFYFCKFWIFTRVFAYKFSQGKLNSHEDVFVTILIVAYFLTSERNLNTLIRVNRLSKLIENCSEGSKLLAYGFSARYN